MKLEDKLMNRIIEGKSDLEEVVSKNGTNVEIGGNLEVGGKLKVNSGFDINRTIQLGDEKIGIISEIDSGNGYSFIGILLREGGKGRYCIGFYEYDISNFQYILFDVADEAFYIQQGTVLSQIIDDEYLNNNFIPRRLYRHDIVGTISDSESVSFTWLVSQSHSSNYDTPINSLTDLVNFVLVGKYQASGVINGKQVRTFVKSSNTASGLKCICVDGTEVTFNPTKVEDDARLLQ